jgi:hypothetical protein
MDWKGLQGTNTIAFYENSQIKTAFFITLCPEINVIRLFSLTLAKNQNKLECLYLARLPDTSKAGACPSGGHFGHFPSGPSSWPYPQILDKPGEDWH